MPKLSFFPQVNLRTYVTMQRQAGTLQFQRGRSESIGSVVCPGLLPHTVLARGNPGQRRHHSGARNPAEHSDSLPLLAACMGPPHSTVAAKFDVMYSPAGRSGAGTPGSLDEFLTERYCVYSWNRRTAVTAPRCIISRGRCSGPASRSVPTAWPNPSALLCRRSRISAIFPVRTKFWRGLRRAFASPADSKAMPSGSRGKQKVRRRNRQQNHPGQGSPLRIILNVQRMHRGKQHQCENHAQPAWIQPR